MVYERNLINIDDLGGTPISGNLHMFVFKVPRIQSIFWTAPGGRVFLSGIHNATNRPQLSAIWSSLKRHMC